MRALGFSLGVLVLSQSVQCLAKALCEKECRLCLFASEKTNTFGNQELGLHLCARPGGNLEEVTEFLWGVSGETLGDIGRNGDDGAAKLIRERKAFFGRQNLTELIDFDNQVHAELPHIQVFEA